MNIVVNLSPNMPGSIFFHVSFSREVEGRYDQKIEVSGDFPETDEPLSILRQKAEALAKTILLAFAGDLKGPAD